MLTSAPLYRVGHLRLSDTVKSVGLYILKLCKTVPRSDLQTQINTHNQDILSFTYIIFFSFFRMFVSCQLISSV